MPFVNAQTFSRPEVRKDEQPVAAVSAAFAPAVAPPVPPPVPRPNPSAEATPTAPASSQ
jgi:hypothetical protein